MLRIGIVMGRLRRRLVHQESRSLSPSSFLRRALFDVTAIEIFLVQVMILDLCVIFSHIHSCMSGSILRKCLVTPLFTCFVCGFHRELRVTEVYPRSQIVSGGRVGAADIDSLVWPTQ